MLYLPVLVVVLLYKRGRAVVNVESTCVGGGIVE